MKSPAILPSNGGYQLPFCLVSISNVHAPHEVEVPTRVLVDLLFSRLAIFNGIYRAGHIYL
jgi:hypothetical protein